MWPETQGLELGGGAGFHPPLGEVEMMGLVGGLTVEVVGEEGGQGGGEEREGRCRFACGAGQVASGSRCLRRALGLVECWEEGPVPCDLVAWAAWEG